ncbi:hypothetical protein I203_106373 [Kwoniella mangroviensis CBS 8507]|uniref:uncharacterized protein n=1 Tax=Kwoniella mangroviensis CBS 8507 TaxID=1296122 RepID=UPI00080D0EE6|nr:uncharacterized protein I203_07650 [Kwoniella mangroviensis CBS 8507]OCF63226.1 hypothetical protein I203_07650 [Kwoniella mangroviensis CBS 8507]
MPSSVHSLSDYDEADTAFRHSLGLGTRRDREDFVTFQDPDGGVMKIPRSEYIAMNIDLEGQEMSEGDVMLARKDEEDMTSARSMESLAKSRSLPSISSTYPFGPLVEDGGMIAEDQVPEMEDDFNDNEDDDGLSLPDLSEDGSVIESPLNDMHDPMEIAATLPEPSISITTPIDSQPNTSTASSAGKQTVEEFRITEGPPPWVLREFETGGGHGIAISPDGSTIVKRTHLQEIIVYERINCNDSPLRAIKDWVPNYEGCFTDHPSVLVTVPELSYPFSKADSSNSHLRPPMSRRPGLLRNNTSDTHSTSIMLENLKYGYKPSTISEFDIKLGRNMIDPWASDNTAPKLKRMEDQVNDTTSKLDAVRLIWANTAIQDAITGEWDHVKTDKYYGKSLKRTEDDHEREDCDTLNDAFVRLFPSPRDTIVFKGDSSRSKSTQPVSAFGSDLERYRHDELLNPEKNPRRFASTMSGVSRTLPDLFDLQRMNKETDQVDLMISTMRHIRYRIKSLKEAVKQTSWRFVGSSLYVVHGEDEEELDEPNGLTNSLVEEDVNESQIDSYLHLIGYNNYNSKNNEYYPNLNTRISVDDLPDIKFHYFSPFYEAEREPQVKLIDFARTDYGEGPDKDVMDGLQTTIDLMSKRIDTLKDTKKDIQSQIQSTRDEIMNASRSY